MNRQSFLSADFFLSINEPDAKRLLASLPGQLPQLRLLTEVKAIHATGFAYHDPQSEAVYHVLVSLCPLDSHYLRFGLHISHSDGHVIQGEAALRQVLHFFEQAVKAAHQQTIDPHDATPLENQPRKTPSLLHYFLSLFLSKHHY